MKTNFNLFLTIIIFNVFTLTSCSDSDEPNAIFPIDQSYWPFKTGNEWNLQGATSEDNMTYDIFHKVSFEGKEYYSFIDQSDEYSYPVAVNEDKGVFKMYYAPHNQQGVNIGGGSITYINLQKAVNEVWTDNMTLTFTSSHGSGSLAYTFTGKITEKKEAETINGKTYKDVIKTVVEHKIFNSLTNITTIVEEETWLSKGVGPIRTITRGDDFEDVYSLVTYTLK